MEPLKTSLLLFALVSSSVVNCAKQPNIVLIVADDYGWNDVGYHGTKQLKTPTLDQLAADGIKLENYYVQPLCTPTRSALLSGKYVAHTGLQHLAIMPCRANGLPLNDPTLATQLKSLGYKTHMVGKWHLGHFKSDYFPTRRGFDTFLGFMNGMEDYFNHSLCLGKACGIDFFDNEQPTDAFHGQYSAEVFADRTVQIVNSHNGDSPLFMYVAFQSVHTPLQAPQQYIDRFANIKDKQRQTYAAMVSAMDDAIKNITNALKTNGFWEDTLVIFTTDNGGMIFGGGNNAPLRGCKTTYFEGGVRGVSFVSGPKALQTGKVNSELMYVADWYPTILKLAGGDPSKFKELDGYDQWDTIQNKSRSQREEILFNIDPKSGRYGKSMSDVFDTGVMAALRFGDWKIITGPPQFFEGWAKEPTEGVISLVMLYVDYLKTEAIPGLKYAADLLAQKLLGRPLSMKNIKLFNIGEDPEEKHELSDQHPEMVELLLKRLAYYNSTSIPVNYPPPDNNCTSYPQGHGGFWGPYED